MKKYSKYDSPMYHKRDVCKGIDKIIPFVESGHPVIEKSIFRSYDNIIYISWIGTVNGNPFPEYLQRDDKSDTGWSPKYSNVACTVLGMEDK